MPNNTSSIVKIKPEAERAIRSFLAEKGCPRSSLRIDLYSNGCCDPSLGLSVDALQENDLVQQVEGLTLGISPEIYRLVGDIIISYVDEIERKGFVLSARKPISEWDGFGASEIRCKNPLKDSDK